MRPINARSGRPVHRTRDGLATGPESGYHLAPSTGA